MTAYFENHSQNISRMIVNSKSKLDIVVCWMTDSLLFTQLCIAARRGVMVRVIVQYDQVNFRPLGIDWNELLTLGAAIHGYEGPGLVHHKFMIADHHVLMGSFNWTRTTHRDSLVCVSDIAAVQSFEKEFQALLSITNSIAALQKKPPPAPAFQTLFRPVLHQPLDLRHAILRSSQVWLSVFQEKEMSIWQRCLRSQLHFLRSRSNFFKNHDGWQEDTFTHWVRQQSDATRRLHINYALKMRLDDLIVAVTAQGQLLGMGMVGSAPFANDHPKYPYARFVQWFPFQSGVPALTQVPKRVFGKFLGSGLRMVSYLND